MQRNREKKGVSTILATVFMIAVIIVGLSAITSGLSFQNNLGQVVTQRNAEESEQGRERIELRDVGIDSAKFNMTVVNAGSLPVKLVRMWVTNTSATTGWHKNYTLNDVINPGGSLPKLGTGLSLTALTDKSYDLNVVTERGTTASFKIMSPKDNALKMSLYITPRSIPKDQNVSILFGVANNLTDGSLVQSITPQISWTRTVDVGSIQSTATLVEGPLPAMERSLTFAETAFFKWVYRISGDAGDKIRFDATVVNAKLGNLVSEEVTIVVGAQSAQAVLAEGIGSVVIDPDSLRHVHTNGDSQSGVNLKGYLGFAVPTSQPTMWSVNVTNGDPQKRNITIYATSLLQTSNTIKHFYVTDGLTPACCSDNQVVAYNTTKPKIFLEYNKTATVYFASSSPSSSSAENTPSENMDGIFIIFSGKFNDGTPYGQTIPFQATYSTTATLTLSAYSGGNGASITVDGSNYESSSKVYVFWRNSDGTTTLVKMVTATSSGAIPGGTTFNVPTASAGYYMVFATDELNTAFKTFQHT
ncbi:MAG: hypothetical protein ACRD38_00795 [Nitrososphaerales archaeon]